MPTDEGRGAPTATSSETGSLRFPSGTAHGGVHAGTEDNVFHPQDIDAVHAIGSSLQGEPDLIDEDSMNLEVIPVKPSKNNRLPSHSMSHINMLSMMSGEIATDSTYVHADYHPDLSKAKIVGVDADNINAVEQTIEGHDFAEFANAAYENPEGYAVRINPLTGQKEMFIAGTRTQQDWFSNVAEVRPLGGGLITRTEFGHLADTLQSSGGWEHHATPWRDEAQKKYEAIAEEEGIEVIYGHSRGGAIVADMDLPGSVQKVGLDAAMVIADNKDMYNYYEAGEGVRGWRWIKSRFDAMIGISGKHNKHLDKSSRFHQVWGD